MSNSTISVEKDLQTKYDAAYTGHNVEWRALGARQKVEHIVELSETFSWNRVLEVGAGDGSILDLLDKHNFCKELYAVEISKSGIEQIEKRKLSALKEVKLFDGYKIPYEDKYFDLVVFSHVLEHVEFPRAILREIARVSKYQIIEVPRDYKPNVDKRIAHFLAYGHISVYTPTLLRYLLKSEKFEVLKDKMSFISNELLEFQLKQKNTYSISQRLKLKAYILLRNFAFRVFPMSRKETMINAYTVLTKSGN